MAALLVSMRSMGEVEAALRGGATVLDVKEPSRGSLGRADRVIVESALECVAGQVPVSAAMGELREAEAKPACSGLAYAKWGLSGWGRGRAWQTALTRASNRLRHDAPGCRLVAVA